MTARTRVVSSFGGADADNYTPAGQTTTTADITPKALSVSGVTAANKAYDGTTTATVNTTNAVYNGLVSGDALGFAATGTFDTKNVGTGKTVTLASSYNGADAGNYLITDQASTTADITAQADNAAALTPSIPPAPVPSTPLPPPPLLDMTLPTIGGGGKTTGGTSTGGASDTGTTGGTDTGTGGTSAAGATAGETSGTGATGAVVESFESGAARGNSESGSGNVNGNDRTGSQASDSLITVSLVRSSGTDEVGIVTVSVPKAIAASKDGFSVPMPKEIVEANGNVVVTLMDGSQIPGWLKYLPESKSLAVSSVAPGNLPIQVLVNVGERQWVCVITERTQ